VISNGQVSVAAVPKVVCVVPAGPCTLVLANAGTAPTAYVGMGGTGPSASNGFPVPSGLVSPVVLPCYAGSGGGTLFAIAASGTASLAWWLSTATGGTGL